MLDGQREPGETGGPSVSGRPVDKADGLFGRLTAYREDVFRVCLGFSRDAAEAEDLCRDVFLKAFGRGETLRSLEGARIWLLRIARTTCLDWIRFNSRRPTISLEALPRGIATTETMGAQAADCVHPPGENLQARRETALARVKSAAADLPRRQREVFILREYGGLSYEEIAHTLKIKLGTVMSRLNRARKAVVAAVRQASEESHE